MKCIFVAYALLYLHIARSSICGKVVGHDDPDEDDDPGWDDKTGDERPVHPDFL